MDNWLKSRLSPVKSETDRWTELAGAIQQFWEENFDPDYARLAGLRSIFTAAAADQVRILEELGRYYDVDIQTDNIPIAVIQRRLELFQKDTLVPLEASLRRACPGINVKWRPEYARRGDVYGRMFYTQESLAQIGKTNWLTSNVKRLDGSWGIKSVSPEQLTDAVFLTSRGSLWVDELTVTNPAITEETIRSRMAIVKPLHIVLDEIIWECLVSVSAGFEFEEISRVNAKCLGHATQGLRVGGAWALGRDTHYIKIDGSWKVNGTSKIGETVNDLLTQRITNSLMSCHSFTTAGCSVGFSSFHLPTLAYGYKVNGGWSVGKKINEVWPAVPPYYISLTGDYFLDGSWEVGGEV